MHSGSVKTKMDDEAALPGHLGFTRLLSSISPPPVRYVLLGDYKREPEKHLGESLASLLGKEEHCTAHFQVSH